MRNKRYTRLAIEHLEPRTMFDASQMDMGSFAVLPDELRNAEIIEWRELAEETQRTVDQTTAAYHDVITNVGGIDQNITASEDAVSTLYNTTNGLRSELDNHDRSTLSLQEQKTAMQNDIENLRSSSSQLLMKSLIEQSRLQDLKEVSAGLQDQRAALEQGLAHLRSTSAIVDSDVTAMQNALAALDESIGQLERTADECASQITLLNERSKELADGINVMGLRMEKLTRDNGAITDDLLVFAEEANKQERLVASASQDVEEATKAYDEASAVFESSLAGLLSAEEKVTQQETVVSTLEETVETLEGKYDVLRNQYNTALKRRPRSSSLERSLKTQMRNVQSQINVTSVELRSEKTTLQTYQSALAEEQSLHAEKVDVLAEATIRLDDAQRTLHESTNELERLNNLITDGRSRSENIKEELAQLQSESDAALLELTGIEVTIVSLEQDEVAASAMIAPQQQERATKAAALQSLEERSDQLHREIHGMENSIGILVQEIDMNDNAVQNSANRIEELERQIVTLQMDIQRLTDELHVLEGNFIGQQTLRDLVFASLVESETEQDRAILELAKFVVERENALFIATTLAMNLTEATETDRATDETLARMIAIDNELDLVEQQQNQLELVVQALLQARSAMRNDETAIWDAAQHERQTELDAERTSIERSLGAVQSGLLAEPTMVTPSVHAYTTSANPNAFIVDAKNLPGGMSLSMGYGGKTWQKTLAAGSSVISVPISALGHDGQGGLGVSLRLKDGTGVLVKEFDFWISGDRFLGDPRSHQATFPGLAHPENDLVREAQIHELRTLLWELARNDIAQDDLESGITLAVADDDPRVAVRFMALLRERVADSRSIGNNDTSIILSREALTGSESLTPSASTLRSPTGMLEAGVQGNTLSVYDPIQKRIVTSIDVGESIGDMAWLQDGTMFAFTAGNRVGIVSLNGKTVQWCTLGATASAVEFLPSGDIAVGLQSGGVCILAWRDGSLVMVGNVVQTGQVSNMTIGAQGLLEVMTPSECLTLVVDGSVGSVGRAASAPEALPSVSGFERFSYESLGMVYVTGSGYAMMAEVSATALGARLYSMVDIDRLAEQFCPEFYGATAEEVDAKLQAWATAHGVNMEFARGERLKAYQRLEEGINTFRAVVTEHYIRAFWIVHDLLVNPNDVAAMQKVNEILYGAGGGQIISSVWTPALPTMRAIFNEVANNTGGIFDRMYGAASHVNNEQSAFWSQRAEANIGSSSATPPTSRQISSHLAAKINAAVASYGGGHAVIAGKTYTVAQLHKASSATPSAYVETALAYDPTQKDPDTLNQDDLTALFVIDSLKKYSPTDIKIESIISQFTSGQLVAIGYASDADVRGVVLQSIQTNAIKDALRWYKSNESASIEANFSTTSDTWAGKIFLGILQEMNRSADPQSMANAVEWTLGISEKSILELSQETPGVFTRGLRRLFENAGYDYIFSDSSSFLEAPFSGARVDKDHYDGGVIKLTWDLPAEIKPEEYLHANIYLIDAATGAKIDDGAAPIGANISALSASIPVSSLNPNGITSVAFKIVLWKEGALQSDGMKPRSVLLSERFTMKVETESEFPIGEYSTLPKKAELTNRRELENIALSALKNHFPVNSGKTWLHTLGSDAHLGNESASMDFNASTGGNTDEDLPVSAIADGTIVSIGLNYGTVRLQHTATVNGESRVWYSTYMHMRLEQIGTTADGKGIFEARDKNGGVITTLTEGDALAAGSTLGGIAGRGLVNGIRSDYAFNTHLHLELEDNEGNAINGGRLLSTIGMQTYTLANDPIPDPTTGKLTYQVYLTWNDEIDEWVEPTYKLIFDQEAKGSGLSNVWTAWSADENQRMPVIWSMQKEIGNPDGVFRFRDANNPSKYWNGSSWIDCQLLP